jgi:GxxExxY protein
MDTNKDKPVEILLKGKVYQIMGAAFEVHKEKGHGFVEAVYQDCLEIEMGYRSIPFESQKEMLLHYHGQILKHTYIPDLICFGQIIVELKAVKELADEHRAQLLNYLRASQMRVGLLINFGQHTGVQWERMFL